jgi:hypothetical protein
MDITERSATETRFLMDIVNRTSNILLEINQRFCCMHEYEADRDRVVKHVYNKHITTIMDLPPVVDFYEFILQVEADIIRESLL